MNQIEWQKIRNELKKIDENAKKYNWSPEFTLTEKVKIIMKSYLDDYENRELTKNDFINYVTERIAEIVYPEDEE